MSFVETITDVDSSSRPPALQNLPAFPPVAGQLTRLVAEEDFSYREVSDLVRADAAFSAELLRLANSPVFAFRHEIRDVPHALAVLGVQRLRGIVMTLAMKEVLLSDKQDEAIRRCWRHNLASALVTESLAAAAWIDKGLAYTAGLLHDVGMLALISNHRRDYVKLVGAPPDAATLLEREELFFGINHCHAGRWLLGQWGLPVDFQDVAAHHHRVPDRGNLDIIALVHISSITADMAGFAVLGEAPSWDPMWPLAWFDEAGRSRLEEVLEDLPMSIATRINSFDCDFLT